MIPRTEVEAVNLRPELLIRAARAGLLWGRLAGEVEYRTLTLSDVELIFSRINAQAEFRRIVAAVDARRPVLAEISLDRALQSFGDIIGVADEMVFAFTKAIADSVEVQDEARMNLRKLLEDIIEPVDVHAIQHTMQLSDEFSVEDQASVGAEKGFSDAVSAAETRAIALQKALEDAIIASDGVSFSFAQSLADTLSAADAVSVTVYKTFDEIVTVSDDVQVGKSEDRDAGDTVGVSDTVALTVEVGFAEAISVAEAFTLVLSLGEFPHSELNGYPLGDWMLGD